MRRLGKFLALGAAEQWATVEAALTLAAIQLLLGRAPRHGWLRLVRRACRDPVDAAGDARRTERVLRALARVSPVFARSTCLGRALTAWVMLRRRGIPSVVRLGVTASAENGFGAHAWLECGGRSVLGEPEPGKYVPLGGFGSG